MEQKDNKRPSRPRFSRPSQSDKGTTFRKKPRFASDGDKEQKPEKADKGQKKAQKQQPAQQQPTYSQDQADSINALRAACEGMGYKPVSWKTGERVQATTTP